MAGVRARSPGRRSEDGNRLGFTTRPGGSISLRTLAQKWHVIRAAAGLSRLRSHHLRSTALSLLLAPGVPPHVVREIVGHSDVKVTMMVYAHVNLDEKATALSAAGHDR